MVYCGKPSRACSECRVKRRKCDLSRPACRQCVRAGSRCDGYRGESCLAFRDQTAETLSKISPFPDTTRPWTLATIALPPEDQALHFFFRHYVVHGPGRAPSHPDCLSIVYTRAIRPGYLAGLIIAVGLVSLAYMRNAPTLAHAASQAFSRALRDMRAALADPSEPASDQMLVAVMLLALNETLTPNFDGNLGLWDRHVDGAVALIHLRGLINCLQRGLRVPTTFINWMNEARNYETAHEAPTSRLADMIVNVCAVLASVKEDSMDTVNLSRFVSAFFSIDTNLERWTKTLPADYGYRILTGPADLQEADMYTGRYDIYPSIAVAHTWNLQRSARIILHQTLVEALSIHFHRPPSMSALQCLCESYGHLLRTSDTVIHEISSDICYSVPYILHACDNAGKLKDLRAAPIVHLLWPLYLAATSHGTSDTLRDWVLRKMRKIEELTGIQKAKLMAIKIQQRC
ncbi:hypothetical protein BDV06DRAFT_217276 [Aspergillus oleicola]